jgi:hypothetical protein
VLDRGTGVPVEEPDNATPRAFEARQQTWRNLRAENDATEDDRFPFPAGRCGDLLRLGALRLAEIAAAQRSTHNPYVDRIRAGLKKLNEQAEAERRSDPTRVISTAAEHALLHTDVSRREGDRPRGPRAHAAALEVFSELAYALRSRPASPGRPRYVVLDDLKGRIWPPLFFADAKDPKTRRQQLRQAVLKYRRAAARRGDSVGDGDQVPTQRCRERARHGGLDRAWWPCTTPIASSSPGTI